MVQIQEQQQGTERVNEEATAQETEVPRPASGHHGLQRSAVEKLSRAARLIAQGARLYAEAASELACSNEQRDVPPVTEVDRERARRALRKAGVRI